MKGCNPTGPMIGTLRELVGAFERSVEMGDPCNGQHQAAATCCIKQAEHKTVPDPLLTQALANRAPSTQEEFALD